MKDDLISRSALLEEMRISGRAAYMIVQEAPAVEAEPVRHGRWTCDDDDGFYETDWHCSECGGLIGYRCGNPVFSKRCPNCGAKMDKE